MRTIGFLILGMTIVGMISCTKPTARNTTNDDPFPITYENDLFSIDLPKGWVCDSSGWKGLDSLQNVVEIFDPNGNVVWFHFVKTFMPIKWKNIDEAKDMAKTARAISGILQVYCTLLIMWIMTPLFRSNSSPISKILT